MLAGQDERLATLVAARPDATLAELREALRTAAGLSTIWRGMVSGWQVDSRRGGSRFERFPFDVSLAKTGPAKPSVGIEPPRADHETSTMVGVKG